MLTIKVADLKPHLAILSMIVKAKTTIPVLANVLIKGTVRTQIIGTDLDHTYICEVPRPDNDGKSYSFNLDYTILRDIVKSTEADQISIMFDGDQTPETSGRDHWIVIKAGQAVWRLSAFSEDAFPKFDGCPDTPADCSLNGEKFRRAIRCSKFAITKEHSRFDLNIAKTLIQDELEMIATNGHMLTYIKQSIEENDKTIEAKIDLQIDSTALNILEKLKTESYRINYQPSNLFFTTDQGLLISRQMPGRFPNYEMVMPKIDDLPNLLTVDAGALLRSARQVMFSQTRERASNLRLQIKKNEVIVHAPILDRGQYQASIPAEASEELEIGFQPAYLIDFLKIIGSGKLQLRYLDSNRQVEFTAVEDGGYEYKMILMPLRI